MISAGQCRAARGLIGWSQSDLAEAAKVGRATIADFEAGKREPYSRTIDDLRGAFEQAGVAFLAPGETVDGGPGVRLSEGWKRNTDNAESGGLATDAVAAQLAADEAAGALMKAVVDHRVAGLASRDRGKRKR